MIYTLTLNPSLDHIIYLDKLVPGELHQTRTDSLYAGGKGINVSYVLKTLGTESTVLGFLAGDTGSLIGTILERDGIAYDPVYTKGHNRINVKISAQEETEINGSGLQPDAEDTAELIRRLDSLQEGDILVISGSIPSALNKDIYDWILGYIAFRGIRFVCDFRGEALKRTFFRGPFLIKPNRKELEEILGRTLNDEEILQEAVNLQAMTEGHVLVSLGADGAVYVSDEGKLYTCPAPSGSAVNTIGSGDAAVAGFLHGYENGRRGQDLLDFAVSCGSACAFAERFASCEEIESVYKTIKKHEE